MSEQIPHLLRDIETKTIHALADGREVVHVGPFVAGLHPTNDLVYLSYAVPSSGADAPPTSEAVEELRKLFRARERVLRFEFFEALWPELGPLLERCGLRLEGRMPLMMCTRADLRTVSAPGVEVVPLEAQTDDKTLTAVLRTAKIAFGMQQPTVEPQEVFEQQEHIIEGRYRSMYARLDGQIAGVGTLVLGNDELAGVGTLPEFRRRGVAATVSSRLVADHFEGGAPMVWLSAGDAVAEAVYRKIGFRSAGVQLHYSDAPASSAT